MTRDDEASARAGRSSRHDAGLYARSFVDVYDDWYEHLHDVGRIVAAVTERVGPGSTVVELGSGSGRIAGPLAVEHTVIALDASLAMLDFDESGSLRVGGDMAELPLRAGCADGAIIAYNTLFNLPDRPAQVACMAEAARVLRPDGVLAVEAFVAPPPDPATPFGLSIVPHHTRSDARMAIATWNDPDEPHLITGAHIELAPDGARSRPWHLTYLTPAELDDVASAAGFGPAERFGDWHGAAFDADVVRHVSWYRRQVA